MSGYELTVEVRAVDPSDVLPLVEVLSAFGLRHGWDGPILSSSATAVRLGPGYCTRHAEFEDAEEVARKVAEDAPSAVIVASLHPHQEGGMGRYACHVPGVPDFYAADGDEDGHVYYRRDELTKAIAAGADELARFLGSAYFAELDTIPAAEANTFVPAARCPACNEAGECPRHCPHDDPTCALLECQDHEPCEERAADEDEAHLINQVLDRRIAVATPRTPARPQEGSPNPMFSTLSETRAPVRIWTDPDTVEPSALKQIRNCAELPWTHGVAVMPDVHHGYGATVGSVIAMNGAVSPGAVGVDIGCGMSAVITDLTADDLPADLKQVRAQIERDVPVGRDLHQDGPDLTRLGMAGVDDDLWKSFGDMHVIDAVVTAAEADRLRKRAEQQLGTLGTGNHFVEVCTDEDDRVWLMLHSGSRHIGNQLAERHLQVAKALDHNAALADPDLAVFLTGTPEMDAYRRDLYWAQGYAAMNRRVMMELVKAATAKALGRDIEYGPEISCHHNYVSEETYDGVPLIITRKGAISTAGGRLGIIPGSMGTGSFIVRGLPNPDAYCSASHGAGRKMSRGAARRTFTVKDLQAQTEGVECRKDEGVVDEIPGAYKNLDDVIAQQRDLIETVHRLRTVLCVKG